jgi:SAM-dependent methyltransferase
VSFSETFGDSARDFFAAADRARVELLPPGGKAAVLELGCGGGATGALALRQRRCASWIGIEADAAAASDALFALTDVHVGALEALSLPYGQGAFDVILLGDGVAGFETPQATVPRLAAMLKGGGWLYVMAPEMTASDGTPAWLEAKSLAKLLRRAGLNAISAPARGLARGRMP